MLFRSSGGLPGEGAKNKRKQTLLSLLDALQELSKDGELDFSSACLTVIRRDILSNTSLRSSGNSQQPSFEDDRDVREFLDAIHSILVQADSCNLQLPSMNTCRRSVPRPSTSSKGGPDVFVLCLCS